MPWQILEHLRLPPETKLPDVLTTQEVRRIIASTRSDQSRTCLWTIYQVVRGERSVARMSQRRRPLP